MLDLLRHGLHSYGALGWPAQLALGLGVPVASFLAGLAVMVGLPPDFFVRRSGVREALPRSRRALRLLLVVARNLLGLTVLLVGFVMALPLVPGPGVLFILLGLALVDFPGKRALQLRLLREPHVLSSVNKMRARFGRPPILTGSGGGPYPRDSVVNSGP